MASAKIRVKVAEAWIEVDAMSAKDAIEALSEYVEVFSQAECGVCKGRNIAPRHRTAQGKDGKSYDYYEMRCLDCWAKLQFGQTLEGQRLFPKRKDKDGNPIGQGGWYQYQGTQSGEYSQTEGGF